MLLVDLYERVKPLGVSLVAGGEGIDRTVRWVHMVESPETTRFLDGNEIAFITGIGVAGNADRLLLLVQMMCDAGASGILINVGPYIRQIPADVIHFCNTRNLPLFRAPWDVHLARVMHVISLSITLSEKEELELSVALKNAIFMPSQEELYLHQIEQAGYRKEWNYCVSVVGLCQGDGDNQASKGVLRSAQTVANDLATLGRWQMTPLVLEDRLALVFAECEVDEVRSMTRRVLDAVLEQVSAEGLHVYVGVGKVTRSARCIGKSYSQATMISRLQQARGRGNELCLYDAMGVDKLLMAINDPSVLDEFSSREVGRLVEYDRSHDSDLADVLSMYLEHNGSVRETAAKLFVHRNTVTYKLNKVESILGVSLADFETRVELYLALKAREIRSC